MSIIKSIITWPHGFLDTLVNLLIILNIITLTNVNLLYIPNLRLSTNKQTNQKHYIFNK